MTDLSSTPLSVVIAGSTEHARMCASAIFADPRFHVTGVITPTPKPSGRKKIVQPNPLHSFAVAHDRPLVIVETKLNQEFQERLQRMIKRPDILLVVDFGYIVPDWMLSWPTNAPVNVHPSDLPKYRGSSPGQFAIAFGEKESAVTVMVMDSKLDHGPIITKVPFTIDPAWLVKDYYQHAFTLMREKLSSILFDFVQNPSKVEPQPDESPTHTARMLKREDGFIPFETLKALLTNQTSPEPIPFLLHFGQESTPQSLYNMYRGFHPWPGLWTRVLIENEEKRLKLLKLSYDGKKLSLTTVQLEGKTPQPASQFAMLFA